MFAQLASLLTAKSDTFSVTATRENPTQLRVTIIPHLSGDKKLNRPLSLVATPEELDSAEFMAALQEHADSVTDLRTAMKEATASNKAEAATAKTAAATARTKKPEPKKPAPKAGGAGQAKVPHATPPKKPNPNNPMLKKKPASAKASPKPAAAPAPASTNNPQPSTAAPAADAPSNQPPKLI